MFNRIMRDKEPTSLEYALLGLLHQQPQSGYDLRKIFATTALGNYSSSPGAIYPALKRLEQRELVDGVVDDTTSLRPKKVFRPTPTGSEIFRRWLLQEISTDDVGRRFDELMLRFAFHPVLAEPGASRNFLLKLARAIEAHVEELEAQLLLFPEEAPIEPRLALEAGIEQYRAAARWARKALGYFKEDSL
jgi:DNA-binding PadR family transcriptional regulator